MLCHTFSIRAYHVSRTAAATLAPRSAAVMSSQDDVDVDTDEITTERDIFLAAVKVEDDVEPPALTFVNVKEEPCDPDEMSSLVDVRAETVDDVLQPVEQIIVDSLVVKSERDEGCAQWETYEVHYAGHTATAVDPLMLKIEHDALDEWNPSSLSLVIKKEAELPTSRSVALYTLKSETISGDQLQCEPDPLSLSSKTEETVELPTSRSGASYTIKTETITCDQLRCESDPLSLSSKTEETVELPASGSAALYTIKSETVVGNQLQRELFACGMCDTICASRDNLDQHVVTPASDDRREKLSRDVLPRYTCDSCSKRYDRKDALVKHLRLHSVAVPLRKSNDSPVSLKQCTAFDQSGDGFNCKSCGKAFASRSDLKSHTSSPGTCDVGRAFACNVPTCRKRFDTRTRLDQHAVVHSDVLALVCDACDFRCRRPDTLRDHKRRHPSSELPMFPCAKCGKAFNRRGNLARHVLTHTDGSGRTFTCDFPTCHHCFNTRSELNRHAISHSDVKSYSCDRCEFRCKRRFDLSTHVRAHSVDDQFPCGECGKKFLSRSKLELHTATHFEDRRTHVCRFATCRKSFETRTLLKAHTGHVHTDGIQFSCDVCEFKSTRKLELVYHLRVHTSSYQEMLSCEECGKKFVTIGRLRSHALTHVSARTFACDVCGKAFRTKAILNSHKMTHSATRKYGCDLCDFRCKRSSSVEAHMRIHSSDDRPPFCCAECGKKFVSKAGLGHHALMHTDDRTFACDVGTCDKRFKTYAVLKRHKTIHSETKDYGCDRCEYRCRRPGYLKGHNMRFHPSNSTNV